MEQLQFDTPEQLANYARGQRQTLDLLRGAITTLPSSRYTSLAHTKVEFARGWLGKLLGSLPDNPHPYPDSINPASTVVAPATDKATEDQILGFWLSEESTPNSRIRRLRRMLADLTLELRQCSNSLNNLNNGKSLPEGSNGLHFWPCLEQCIMQLHEASMALGFELEQISKSPAAALSQAIEEYKNAPIGLINTHNSGEFFSTFGIKEEVEFRPMFRHQQQLGIADEYIDGRIVAVRFTECKVFYDILSIYHGSIFEGVDSSKVQGSSIQPLPQKGALANVETPASPADGTGLVSYGRVVIVNGETVLVNYRLNETLFQVAEQAWNAQGYHRHTGVTEHTLINDWELKNEDGKVLDWQAPASFETVGVLILSPRPGIGG